MITSIYENSVGKNRVIMGEREAEALENLRAFMFDRVYITPLSMKEEERAKRMLSGMYEFFLKNRDKLPRFLSGVVGKISVGTGESAISFFHDG